MVRFVAILAATLITLHVPSIFSGLITPLVSIAKTRDQLAAECDDGLHLVKRVVPHQVSLVK